MADRRRIVVDTSALAPAFFPDGLEPTDRRAQSIVAAIENRTVVAFAPDMIRAEMLKLAVRRLEERVLAGDARALVVAEVEEQWMRFLRVRLVYTPAEMLAMFAWDATVRFKMPAPDSWFGACAMHHEAELWYSHPAEDRAGEHAREFGVDVRYLSQQPFGG